MTKKEEVCFNKGIVAGIGASILLGFLIWMIALWAINSNEEQNIIEFCEKLDWHGNEPTQCEYNRCLKDGELYVSIEDRLECIETMVDR